MLTDVSIPADLRGAERLATECRLPLGLLRPHPEQSLALVPDLLASCLDAVGDGTLIVLAVDGVGFDLARKVCATARLVPLTSTFPSTSVVAWLTAATGIEPSRHGVLGVVYRLPERDAHFHVFLDRGLDHDGDWDAAPARLAQIEPGAIPAEPASTFFERFRDRGVDCVANPGELANWPGRWRDSILRGADVVPSDEDWAALRHRPEAAWSASRRETEAALAFRPRPRLVWSFLNLDDHVHAHGYDERVLAALAELDAVCAEWASAGHLVVAYSDHGLVETTVDSDDAAAWSRISGPALCRLPPGGAGRARWAYPRPGAEDDVRAELEAALEGEALVLTREGAIELGLLADTALVAQRVGEVVALATGTRFPVPSREVRFDHGSCLPEEMLVPFAVWTP